MEDGMEKRNEFNLCFSGYRRTEKETFLNTLKKDIKLKWVVWAKWNAYKRSLKQRNIHL